MIGFIILIKPSKEFLRDSMSILASIFAIKPDNLFAIFITVLVTESAIGIIADFISFIFSRNVLNSFTSAPFCSINGDINKAPILANAALTFDREPVKVSLAFLACSPKASSIAAAKVSNEIFPFETISLTSDSDLFK